MTKAILDKQLLTEKSQLAGLVRQNRAAAEMLELNQAPVRALEESITKQIKERHPNWSFAVCICSGSHTSNWKPCIKLYELLVAGAPSKTQIRTNLGWVCLHVVGDYLYGSFSVKKEDIIEFDEGPLLEALAVLSEEFGIPATLYTYKVDSSGMLCI